MIKRVEVGRSLSLEKQEQIIVEKQKEDRDRA